MTTAIHTIGHSHHPIDRFIDLLRTQGVKTLVDVRSRPYSRWAPQFKQSAFVVSLAAAGIEYVFLGESLGGRPEGAEFYDAEGNVDYERRALARDFQAGVVELVERARTSATAIVCAEEDPARCHRRLLVTPALLREDFDVLHIRGDGRVQPEGQARGPKAPPSLFE